MESWFRCWISLWMVNILVRNVLLEPVSPLRYTVHHTQVSFDQAMKACSPGVITSLATQHEVANVLELISKSVSFPTQNEFTFWVGLRKVKNECVVSTLPLRGFKWTEDGSEESQVIRWKEEPKPTCTTVRCAAIRGQLNGLTVTGWGLIPVSCKNSYHFICKQRDTPTRTYPLKPVTSEPEPAAPETKPAVPKSNPATSEPKLATPEPKLVTPEPHKAELTPQTQKPGRTAPQPDLPAQEPEPDHELKLNTGPELTGPDPDPGSVPVLRSDLCQHPHISTARSIILDPDNSSRIQVECWSVRLELRCMGHPAVWRLLDDSPANFTTICDPCEEGFQKDTSGNCVDIDECSGGGGSCRHTCRNTVGSYSCVCSDQNGKHHDEDLPGCTDTVVTDNSLLSGILIPVLVAVASLVVLVVLVAVIVKCCLMRRSKKRAMK